MRQLKVLMVHNGYQQRGGEDSVVDSEIDMLRGHGHEVQVYRRHNDDIHGLSRARLLAETLWSGRTVDDITALAKQFRPDVIHVHNTMPLVSPSVFWAADRLGMPIVQTLHNFRLVCLDATFLRDGQVCEDCLGKAPWRGVVRRCYRGSAPQSTVMATMLMAHRAAGTFQHKVTRYIALNEFCKRKLVQGGLPADRISVKPNFLEWRDAPAPSERRGGLYVGRLSTEKGIAVLLAALRDQPGADVRVVGTGPFAAETQALLGELALGFRPLPEVLSLMASAAYLVLPSVCYEGFPRTIVEAYACGLPVIASRLGSMAELVDDGQTGLLFTPGDPADLAAKLAWAAANPAEMRRMGQIGRERYEQRFTPDINHRELLHIYEQAIAERRETRGSPRG
ncbi:MAG: glycosyltransferase family 1 protein [Rubrivivax sp.]|nr:MAG: glycosyltransferase family 1 protein [Rubrivivax sp.]